MLPSSHRLAGAVLLPLILIGSPLYAEPSDPGSRVGYYLERFGHLGPDADPLTVRAHAIFDRLLRVVESTDRYLPRLAIVDSAREPWAIALPDGHVVLSGGALEVLYRDVEPWQGDARMAFVLGHELAHLSRDHFWHRELFAALAGGGEGGNLLQLLAATADVPTADWETRLAVLRQKELEADDAGLRYAALAGFPVEVLLGDPAADQPDIFTFWVEQTQVFDSPAHPDAADRAALLRTRLRGINAGLGWFHAGVRLTHFGRHDAALHLLREFQREFPAREVMTNLGYSHLALAREAMGGQRAEYYCLPRMQDTESLLRDTGPLPEPARQHLRAAVTHLRRAAEADARYWPARLNLATAYTHLEEPHLARAAIEEARALAPEEPAVVTLHALLVFLDAQQHGQPDFAALRAAAEHGNCALYNLARALDETGRTGEATPVWQRLAEHPAELSQYQHDSLCRRLRQPELCAPPPISEVSLEPPWPAPVPVGFDLLDTPAAIERYLHGWSHQQLAGDGQVPPAELYRHPQGDLVLVLDGYVELVIVRGRAPIPADRLPEPDRRVAVTVGEVWDYPDVAWTALVIDDEVREAWFVRPP